ncbi:hypothetical protein [Streptomyces sp. IMTB 2501]|uniref:hypothetical protein n=1 Tax=Streptomyces sp. IMTB 2501 TaxID=1776340 RepID=UPI002115DBB7|nr:hypothetical protein [Streptomyces sp. IMTB 2501]
MVEADTVQPHKEIAPRTPPTTVLPDAVTRDPCLLASHLCDRCEGITALTHDCLTTQGHTAARARCVTRAPSRRSAFARHALGTPLAGLLLAGRRASAASRGGVADGLPQGRMWPHPLINNQTANTTSRASNHWISAPMRGQDATLERLRVDRQLEEAMAKGLDPLHLAEVFGLDEKTAMRYADSARALLQQAAEQPSQ